MNKKQKIILYASVTSIVLMTVFPPVGPYTVSWDGVDLQSHLIGGGHAQYFGFIIEDSENIRYGLLCIQYGIVAVVAGCLICVFRDKNLKDDQKQ